MITLDPAALYPLCEVAKLLKVDVRTVRRASRRIGKKLGALKTPYYSAAEIRALVGVR